MPNSNTFEVKPIKETDFMPNVDAEQSDFLSCAIKMYLLKDDKSQKMLIKAEQQQLKDWTNSVKGE